METKLFPPYNEHAMGIIDYIKETQAEATKVSWPTTKQATWLSVVVILVSVLVAAYLGLFDFIFARLLGDLVL